MDNEQPGICTSQMQAEKNKQQIIDRHKALHSKAKPSRWCLPSAWGKKRTRTDLLQGILWLHVLSLLAFF